MQYVITWDENFKKLTKMINRMWTDLRSVLQRYLISMLTSNPQPGQVEKLYKAPVLVMQTSTLLWSLSTQSEPLAAQLTEVTATVSGTLQLQWWYFPPFCFWVWIWSGQVLHIAHLKSLFQGFDNSLVIHVQNHSVLSRKCLWKCIEYYKPIK